MTAVTCSGLTPAAAIRARSRPAPGPTNAPQPESNNTNSAPIRTSSTLNWFSRCVIGKNAARNSATIASIGSPAPTGDCASSRRAPPSLNAIASNAPILNR